MAATNSPSQTISLPKGGGALSGLGEKFVSDPHTGTGKFTVPIVAPPGRNGLEPRLNLIYSTGQGNGPFGLGWELDTPSIDRQTTKGVPRYDDSRDTFVLSGAEDLVPIGQAGGVARYRPRTEGLFARIGLERSAAESHWRVETKDGLASTYGTASGDWPAGALRDPAAITKPGSRNRIFSWKISRTADSFGNWIEYAYERDPSQSQGPHSWDQLYLQEVRYGNSRTPADSTFLTSIKFVYENRPDPFSSYRSGFEIRTVRRCSRIEVASNAGTVRRIRTYHLKYLDQLVAPELLPKNGVSLLSRISVEGHGVARSTGQDVSEWLPPLEFHYSAFRPEDAGGRNFFPLPADLPSSSLANPDYELVDLFGNGLPDILELSVTPRYWRNLGGGQFAPPRMMTQVPVALTLAQTGVQIADCDGDGRPDLLATLPGFAGYFSLRHDGEWDERSFTPFAEAPSFTLEDPEVRLVDLDGDGITDVIRSDNRLHCIFNGADRRKAWSESRWIERGSIETFPDVVFSDQRVRLADMSGDGLQDIVMLYDGSVDYWPNLGHGDWGRRVQMRRSPRLPKDYDPKRILMGDIDGDGVADLAYVEDTQVTIWINQSGYQWSEPVVIRGTPPASDLGSFRLADLLGSGVSGVLWTADDTVRSGDRYLFLDLTGGVKPYLLTEMDNHLGATTRVEYRSSTAYYLDDETSHERRWRTTLPFPVQVVARVETVDHLSAGKLVTTYRYHHGYWDGAEREFRGFAMVEQFDTELFERYREPGLHGSDVAFRAVPATAYSPPILVKTWFHPGPVARADGEWTELDLSDEYWSEDPNALGHSSRVDGFLRVLPTRQARRDALRSLRGTILRTEHYALDGSALEKRPYTVTVSSYGIAEIDPPVDPFSKRRRIFFPHQRGARTTQWERGSDPATQLSFTDDYDLYGQPRSTVAVAVPQGREWTTTLPAGAASEPYLASLKLTRYAQRDDSTWYCVDRVASTASFEIVNDGTADAFTLHADALAGVATRRPLGQTINYYDGAAFVGGAVGDVGRHGMLVRSISLVLTPEIIVAAYGPAPPPYITAAAAVAWTAEYPAGFRSLAARAGYEYHPAGGAEDFLAGFFAPTDRRQYDFQLLAGGVGLTTAIRDPLGHTTSFEYDSFGSLPVTITDPSGLTTRAVYDYRVFQPKTVTDPNGNITEFHFGPQGFLQEIWSRGKAGEGDQNRPSVSWEYDLLAFDRSTPADRKPAFVRAIRSIHHDTDTDIAVPERDRTVETREYSDGFGRLLQTRTQAEDVIFGTPPLGDSGLPADQSQSSGPATGAAATTAQRVIVSGWQVYDNKGRIVEKFEPFFAEGWAYASPALTAGPKTTITYDPRGNVVRTVTADGAIKLAVHGVPAQLDQPGSFTPTPWETYTYEVNDNAGRSHPTGSVGYRHHWNTPSSVTLDALGRVVRTTRRNRLPPLTPAGPLPPVEEITNSSTYDLVGNVLSSVDPLGRIALRTVYDLLKRPLQDQSIDAGVRVRVLDAAGNVIEQRDNRGALLLRSYDGLSRPTALWARDAAGQPVTRRMRCEYGTGADSLTNRAGRLTRQFDEAGLLTAAAYDFKGNLLESTRRVFAPAVLQALPFTVDWETGVALDSAGLDLSRSYDALGRTTTLRYPADSTGARKVATYRYNGGGTLERLELDGQPVIERMAYNSRGQRVLMVRGNGLMTRWTYDPTTFRLSRIRTEMASQTAPHTYTPTGSALQDLGFNYDLAGNLLTLVDRTPDSGVRNNPEASRYPTLAAALGAGDALVRTFTYDALDRLITASGRECANVGSPRPWTDPAWPSGAACGYYPAAPTQGNTKDLTSLYSETYEYDPAANLTAVRHQTQAASWNRLFGFGGYSPAQWRQEWQSRLVSRNTGGAVWAGAPGNQLTNAGDNLPGVTANHQFDPNGNLIAEQLNRGFEWDHSDRLRGFWVQAAGARSLEAQYCYDAGGQRVLKLVRKQGGELEITVMVGGLFERFSWTGAAGGGSNDLLHLMNDQARLAQVRVGAARPGDASPAVQYPVTDHLMSCALVAGGTSLGSATAFVNREEFYPWGETSFGSFGRKRFRFSGRERDEESGLGYYGARYYSPVTGHWVSPDPSRADADEGLYSFARNNPLRYVDRSGLQAGDPESTNKDQSRAANAGLQAVELQMESHALSLEVNGIGTYQGTKYTPDKKERADDKAKAAKANITIRQTDCITLLQDGMTVYQDALLKPWGQITERAADARGKGELEVDTARGTTLLKEARARADFTTVYVIDPDDKEWKANKKRGMGAVGSKTVKGADTGKKYDVRLPLDQFVKQKEALKKLKDVPFGLGITVDDWGTHTFVFAYGDVYEVHQDKGPQSSELFEKSTLEQFMKDWGSVVIAIPPGPWEFGQRQAKQAAPR